jgi:hypothetical protein
VVAVSLDPETIVDLPGEGTEKPAA